MATRGCANDEPRIFSVDGHDRMQTTMTFSAFDAAEGTAPAARRHITPTFSRFTTHHYYYHRYYDYYARMRRSYEAFRLACFAAWQPA